MSTGDPTGARSTRNRSILGLTVKDLLVLCAYIAVVCFAVSHYQAWEDEGRAWTDVKYFGLFDLIFHILRYEGHPALWYLLLWPFVHLHMPFVYINWVSAACAVAGIWFLLRSSPFPFYIRALLPFGFALAYQYAVVARGYVLFPLLGFMVAHEYRHPVRRPIRMAIYLALLANLTVHGTIVAFAFGVSYAWDLYKERRGEAGVPWTIPQARHAAAVFAGSLLFVVVVLWPPRDLKPPVSPRIGQVINKLAPASYQPHASPRFLQIAATPTPPPTPPADLSRALNLGIGYGLLTLRERLSLVFVYPVATFVPLALTFEALVFILLWRRGKPILILGQLLLAAFIVEVYLKLWHVSLVWITFVLLLWAVWDPQEDISLPRPALTLQNCIAALFALICLLQIPWTIAALRFERTHSTYPAQAAANYLNSLSPRKRIDGYDHSSVLPYLAQYPFHLQADALDVPTALADHPDVILFRDTTVSDPQLAQLASAGYTQSRSFCGTPYFPNQPLVPLCLIVLEKP